MKNKEEGMVIILLGNRSDNFKKVLLFDSETLAEEYYGTLPEWAEDKRGFDQENSEIIDVDEYNPNV